MEEKLYKSSLYGSIASADLYFNRPESQTPAHIDSIWKPMQWFESRLPFGPSIQYLFQRDRNPHLLPSWSKKGCTHDMLCSLYWIVSVFQPVKSSARSLHDSNIVLHFKVIFPCFYRIKWHNLFNEVALGASTSRMIARWDYLLMTVSLEGQDRLAGRLI